MLHPIVRKVIGYELSPEEKLLVDLLNGKATDREDAIDPARLTDDEDSFETSSLREGHQVPENWMNMSDEDKVKWIEENIE